MRILLVVWLLVVLGACGGKRTVGASGASKETSKEAAKAEAEEAGVESQGRKEVLTLEFSDVEDREGVQLVTIGMTDETGAADTLKVGVYQGPCRRLDIGAAPGAAVAGELLAAECSKGGAGTVLRFVLRSGQLILLEARFDSPEDERAYEQRGEFPLPSGATIEAAPMEAE